MRMLIAIFTVVLSASPLAEARTSRFVTPRDVTRADALEALAASNPDHYRRLTGLIAASRKLPCEPGKFQVLKVEYDARSIGCDLIVLTSFPPQRRMSFVLDDQAYVINVMLELPAFAGMR